MTDLETGAETRVLLVDDQELVRSGLRRILRRRDGFVVVGECGDGAEVPAAVASREVDVVVMDLRMKDVDGIEATRRLRASGAHPPVLALTTFDDDELLAGALRAGAAGYVLKDAPAEDLIRAVRAVASGAGWLDPAVTARVLAAYRQGADPPQPSPNPAARLRFAVLGPLRAWHGDTALDLGPVRQRAVLAALVLRPNVTVSQQQLLDGVWGLEPPNTGSKIVPVYIHRLRKRLQLADRPADAVIRWDGDGYRFVGDDVSVDAAQLDAAAAEAREAARSRDLPAAVAACGRALDLFQGEPLAGLPGPFAAGERRRLAEQRMALTLQKLDWQLRLGRHTEVIAEASGLTHLHPHSEPVAALLMRACYAAGRQADALAVFDHVRERLRADLGVPPGPELRRLHHALRHGEPLTRHATEP